jgi:outer membrane immunogenic protein
VLPGILKAARALVVIILITAGFARAVIAADLPVTRVPTAPVANAPEAIYNWTGFYLGAHAGGGFDNATWSDPFTGASHLFGGSGALGGFQAGANLQLNWLVLGIEGDFSWTGLRGSGTDSIGDTLGTRTNWTSMVAGRVGAAFDRLLLYGKGGAAFAQDRNTFTDLFGSSAAMQLMRTGWTVGAGIEYGIAPNWSARFEYDYLNFGSLGANFATVTPVTYSSAIASGIHEFKAGISFHFGGP